MNIKRKCKVVMLPTNKKATDKPFSVGITLCNDGKLRIGNPVGNSESRQELYFLSDEESFCTSDWVLEDNKLKLFNSKRNPEKCIKVISSTRKDIDLPEPSPGFIQAYIKAWNEGKPITEVMVDYEERKYIYPMEAGMFNTSKEPTLISKLKVDKNNQITITKVKDSWSREEVIALHKANCERLTNSYISSDIEWIEENL